jgi:hypothetical protein
MLGLNLQADRKTDVQMRRSKLQRRVGAKGEERGHMVHLLGTRSSCSGTRQLSSVSQSSWSWAASVHTFGADWEFNSSEAVN